MKKLLFLAVALLIVPPIAHADYFQIFDRSSPYYIQYAPVSVMGQFYGYTDMYGRISLGLPLGTYDGEIAYGDQRRRIHFRIDGSQYLKRLDAE